MQYNKKSVEDIEVAGKKVIVRCDFNVPQDDTGRITDDKRIVASLQTIWAARRARSTRSSPSSRSLSA